MKVGIDMIWKEIKRNCNYSISKNGDIKNNITGKIKSTFVNKANGYLTADLYEKNVSRKVPVHRLLAEAFIQNSENKPCVDHKDGNRLNNSISNLRWATYSENNSRFNTIGVRSEKIKVIHYKELRKKRGGGHLEWLDVDNILFFDRIKDACEYFSCTNANITLMLKAEKIGSRGKMRGYKFEYSK